MSYYSEKIKSLHWDNGSDIAFIKSHPDLPLSQLQQQITDRHKTNIPFYLKEYAQRSSTLPFPPQEIKWNSKRNKYEFFTEKYGYVSDYSKPAERNGAAILGLETLASFFVDQKPGASAILFSPSGPDFTGKNLPETQVYYYEWTGSHVCAVTLRLDDFGVNKCEDFCRRLGVNLQTNPDLYVRTFDICSRPIAFTPQNSKTLSELTTLLQQTSGREYAKPGVTFADLATQAKATLEAGLDTALNLEAIGAINIFCSSIMQTRNPEELVQLLQSKDLYDLLISVSQTTTRIPRPNMSAWLGASPGCNGVGGSRSGESEQFIYIDGTLKKLIYRCGVCSIDLGWYRQPPRFGAGLYMAAHDRCPSPACGQEYLGC